MVHLDSSLERGARCDVRDTLVVPRTSCFVFGLDQAEFGQQLSLADADCRPSIDGK